MTKTSAFADLIKDNETATEETKKKIVFEEFFSGRNLEKAVQSPEDFDSVILLQKHYRNNQDLIMAYNTIDDVFIYMGQWNDGIV